MHGHGTDHCLSWHIAGSSEFLCRLRDGRFAVEIEALVEVYFMPLDRTKIMIEGRHRLGSSVWIREKSVPNSWGRFG